MPIGIVDDADFNSEITSLSDSINTKKSIFIPPVTKSEDIDESESTKGRGKGNREVPDGMRQLIGEEAKINGRASAIELARNFGISESSVSAYTNGSTSTASYDKQPNLDYLNKAKMRASKRARIKMMRAMHHITEDKLQEAKPGELAGVARNLSNVIKDLEPDAPRANALTQGTTFIFYTPTLLPENTFDIIDVKD